MQTKHQCLYFEFSLEISSDEDKKFGNEVDDK